ncbi:MAG TPA: zf-HC2 domain-containing protein [Bryobacteraceae bacterium]|nr:zf-HC2 domain-containing protein [Bryobacteraceae bacterium]
MTKCPMETREQTELLLAYSAGRLSRDVAAGLEQHMEGCAACREFAQGQQKVWQALEFWEETPVSADFDRRLYRRIEERTGWWDRVLLPLRPMLVRRGLPIAAAAGLVVMAGVLLDRPAAPVLPSQPPPAQVVEVTQPEQVEHALDDLEMLSEFNDLVTPDTPDPSKI